MKIALIGICQVVGMAEALQALFPDAIVNRYHFERHSPAVDDLAVALPGYDFVITQVLPVHNLPPLTYDRLQAMGLRRLKFVPPLIFPGFHSDSCIIASAGGQLESPIESFHSVLLAAAYLIGLPPTRAVKLFNSFIYSKLGYFKAFEASKKVFSAELEKYGCGDIIPKYWDMWMSEGSFMHTSHHPKIRVLASIATFCAQSVGLLDPDVAVPSGVSDILDEQHGWPVYPELARKIGIDGDMVFRRYRRAVKSESERYLTLTDFAEESYAIFRRTDRNIIEANRRVSNAADILRNCVSS